MPRAPDPPHPLEPAGPAKPPRTPCAPRTAAAAPALTRPFSHPTRSFDVPNHRLKAWNEQVQRQLLQHPADYLPGFQDAIRDYIRGLDATRALAAGTEIHVGISGEFGALEVSPRCVRLLGSNQTKRSNPARGRALPCGRAWRPSAAGRGPAARRPPRSCRCLRLRARPPPAPRTRRRCPGPLYSCPRAPRELSSTQLGRLVKVYGIVTKCSLVRPKLVKSVHYCPDTQLQTTREYRDVTSLVGLPTGEPCARGLMG